MRGRSISIRPVFLIIFIHLFSGCYHGKPVNVLPKADQVKVRTLFIGLDGIDHELVAELKSEGHFAQFKLPVPLVSTFPSATTIGFTGIFQPLGTGKVVGYESRFYSLKENKIVGGTPFDAYEYPIGYKYYFDYFRHTMQAKSVMYSFPSMASKQDLVNTRETVFDLSKSIVMTYMGGTDGSAHLLGRSRTKRTLRYMSDFLDKLVVKHQEIKGEPLRIVLFSDHGFQYNKLKTVSNAEIKSKLSEKGFIVANSISGDQDVVFSKFGLISSGVAFTKLHARAEKARVLSQVTGVDIVFWHLNDKKKIYVRDAKGHEAYFEYRSKKQYRYVPVTGDPLNYVSLLQKHGYSAKQWLKDDVWKNMSFDHDYPDVGYRVYDSFFVLVENAADILFSTEPNYQFGSLMARMGTWTRLGQRGTHGGLFRQTSWAFVMTNYDDNPKPPKFFRYDEMFPYFIPKVANSIKTKVSNFKSDAVHANLKPETSSHNHDHQTISMKQSDAEVNHQLAEIEKMILE